MGVFFFGLVCRFCVLVSVWLCPFPVWENFLLWSCWTPGLCPWLEILLPYVCPNLKDLFFPWGSYIFCVFFVVILAFLCSLFIWSRSPGFPWVLLLMCSTCRALLWGFRLGFQWGFVSMCTVAWGLSACLWWWSLCSGPSLSSCVLGWIFLFVVLIYPH